MRTIPVRAVHGIEDRVLSAIERAFGQCHTLADLLRWTAEQQPRVHIGRIITQDEYTHDVVLPFGSVFLSFDTN